MLAAGFLVLFIGGGSRFAIGLTLKPMVEEFGWDRSQLGLAVAVFQIVSAASMYAAGILADRMSLRRVLGGGLAASGVAIGLMSLVSHPGMPSFSMASSLPSATASHRSRPWA